mgnify:CR=1 FL=1
MFKHFLLSLMLLAGSATLFGQTECDCEFDLNPVCIEDADGNIIAFPNACFAECEGFNAEDFVDCGDDGPIFPDCDCDFDEIEVVCVEIEEGIVIPFPNACFAECEGFSAENFVDCNDDGPTVPECDCDFEELEIVCVEVEEGVIFSFPNACFAECEGFSTEDFVDCGDDGPVFPDCDCDFEELEIVCVEVEEGIIIPFPNACFAECEGFTAEDFVECDDDGPVFPECDCDFEDLEIICVEVEEGIIIPFPNACFAECEGFTAEDFVDCGDAGEVLTE